MSMIRARCVHKLSNCHPAVRLRRDHHEILFASEVASKKNPVQLGGS